MSFTRRVKYGNIMATKKFKKSITSERLEVAGFLLISVVTFFVIKISFLSIASV